jgi:hypothetical protein
MKNPAYEQIQPRKVKARLRMLQHAQRLGGNVSQTCRFLGESPAQRSLDESLATVQVRSGVGLKKLRIGRSESTFPNGFQGFPI